MQPAKIGTKKLLLWPPLALVVWVILFFVLVCFGAVMVLPAQDIDQMPSAVYSRYVQQVAISNIVSPILFILLLIIIVAGMASYIYAARHMLHHARSSKQRN